MPEQISNETLDKVCSGWVMVIFGIAFLALTSAGTIFVFTRSPAVADRCALTPTGETAPTRVVDGEAVAGSASILARTFDGKQDQFETLASCQRGACRGPFRQLEKFVNRPVHAEFCGSTLVRVVFEGNEVYRSAPKTQGELDNDDSTAKRIGLVLTAIPLLLIAIGVTRIRNFRINDRA